MKDVLDFFNKKMVIEDSSYVVAAISGGPDSMALLNVLMNLRKNINFNIVCAHVNHNVRVESEEEKVFLENYCKKNDIIFEYMKIEKYSDDNFHDYARNVRYNFFEDLIRKYNSKYLFTAHHGDDLVETILMRITRGSNLNGYSGFQIMSKRDNYTIVRPLIYMTKDELLQYDIDNNIPYAIDKSNEKDCYTRNRYRKYVLPFLKQENKNIHKKYIDFSNELYKYEQFINGVVNEYYDSVYNDKLILDKFLKLDILIQEKILEKILNEIYKTKLNVINNKHIKSILKLISSNRANAFINLPDNIIVKKEYNYLIFTTNNTDFNKYKIELKDKVIINDKTIEIVSNSDDTSNYCIKLNSKEIKLPLYIRNKCNGDKMEVKGLNGTKKVKDIFINEKLSIDERNRFPILVDSNDEILWLPGLKKSKYDKAKDKNYDIIIKCY